MRCSKNAKTKASSGLQSHVLQWNRGTPKSSICRWDFPVWTIQLLGYPHDYGTPPFMDVWECPQLQKIWRCGQPHNRQCIIGVLEDGNGNSPRTLDDAPMCPFSWWIFQLVMLDWGDLHLTSRYHQDITFQPCAGTTKLPDVRIWRSLPCGRLHTPLLFQQGAEIQLIQVPIYIPWKKR